MSYKTQLEQILDERGIKKIWVAKKLAVSPNTVSNWTSGKTSPNDAQKIEISFLLDLQVQEVFFSEPYLQKKEGICESRQATKK